MILVAFCDSPQLQWKLEGKTLSSISYNFIKLCSRWLWQCSPCSFLLGSLSRAILGLKDTVRDRFSFMAQLYILPPTTSYWIHSVQLSWKIGQREIWSKTYSISRLATLFTVSEWSSSKWQQTITIGFVGSLYLRSSRNNKIPQLCYPIKE